MSETTDIVARLSGMSADHDPDGWPAVQMRDITALCEEVTRLRAALAQAGAPDGWRLAPMAPTPEMEDAAMREITACDEDFKDADFRVDFRVSYRAAIAAAPTAHPSPAQREPLSDAQIARLSDLPQCWGDGSGADFLHVPFARQIEAACAAAWGVKLAAAATPAQGEPK